MQNQPFRWNSFHWSAPDQLTFEEAAKRGNTFTFKNKKEAIQFDDAEFDETVIEHEIDSLTAADFLKRDSAFPEIEFDIPEREECTLTLLKKRSIGEVLLSEKDGPQEKKRRRSKLNPPPDVVSADDADDFAIRGLLDYDTLALPQAENENFKGEVIPAPKNLVLQEQSDTETEPGDQFMVDEAGLEKQLTGASKSKRGRKKENWDVYLKSAMKRISQNKRKLEAAKDKGNTAECGRLRNMISAQQSRLKKKFEVKYLYNLHQERDNKVEQFAQILSSRLASHPQLLGQIIRDVESQIVAEDFDMFGSPKSSETSSKKRHGKQKAKASDLKECLVQRLKTKPSELGRYQQNSEKESDDYLFDSELLKM